MHRKIFPTLKVLYANTKRQDLCRPLIVYVTYYMYIQTCSKIYGSFMVVTQVGNCCPVPCRYDSVVCAFLCKQNTPRFTTDCLHVSSAVAWPIKRL